MGNSCGLACIETILLADKLTLINTIVSFFGIIINSVLAYWIVKTIQYRLTNRRFLKDHFITELKDIRTEYKNCLNSLYANKANPKTLIPWFKLMNIKTSDLMSFIASQYKIKDDFLHPYQIELRELITDNSDFIAQYSSQDQLCFTEESRNSIIKFQQENNHLFNEIIIKINESE